MKKRIILIIVPALLVAACALTTAAAESKTETREKPSQAEAAKHVSLVKPYPVAYAGAPTDRISVQYAVIELGQQIGLRYDWETSARNTEGLCRRWVYPDIKNQLFERAMKDILSPLGLSYDIRDGNRIVLAKP